MTKKIALFAAATAAVVAASSPASAATGNLITNGGFETTTLTRSQQLNINNPGEVTGWSNTANGGWTGMGYNFLIKSNSPADSNTAGFYSVAGNHDYVFGPNGGNVASPGYNCGNFGCNNYSNNGYTTSPTGGNYMLMDGDSNFRGALTQTVNGLVAGQSYTLTFDWAGATWATQPGATTQQFEVSFGNSTQSTTTLNTPAKGFSGWQTATMNFVAGSSSQTLSFLAKGTPNGLPPSLLLDNVSMTAAVPEPATWAMMLVGFGMVGAASRYRRRKSTLAAA